MAASNPTTGASGAVMPGRVLAKASEAYEKASKAYDVARKAYDEAKEAYDKAWDAYVKADPLRATAQKGC